MELAYFPSLTTSLPHLQTFTPPRPLRRSLLPKQPPPQPILPSPHTTCNHPPPPTCNHHSTLKTYSSILHSLTSKGSLIAGKALHARLLRLGIEPDTHLRDSLINLYSKCGGLDYAQQLFDEMPDRDIIAWTTMITGCSSAGDGREGVRLFGEMKRYGTQPNAFALTAGLRASAMCLDYETGQQMHAEAIKRGSLSDSFVGSSLVDLYVKCGEVEHGEKAFFGLPEWNVVSWNSLLNGYARVGDERMVVELFVQVVDFDTRFNEFTLSIVLKCCVGLGDLRLGQAVHSMVVKIGLEMNAVFSSTLVDMYSKCGLADDAWQVFDEIKEPDVVVWSAMISCFARQGFSCEAIELFETMRRKGVEPNQFVLSSVASVASQLGDQRFCGSVHAYIVKSGYEMGDAVGNAVLQMYMNVGAVRDGCLVFDYMVDRDTSSWNTLLSGFQGGSNCVDGLRIFSQMLSEDYKPNNFTFTSILRLCSSLMELSFGAQVHAHILKDNFHSDPFVGKSLVDMYANCGCFDDACVVFNMLTERDVFTWTVIIAGYTKNDQGEKAIDCYRQMQREGVCPNEFTLSSCLRACSNLASLDSGCQFHSRSVKSGQSDAFTSSALMDMYLKCGCLKYAESVFNSSIARDAVSWNTIICGYSQHGYGEKALEAFQCMIDAGEKPDEVTFMGVLSACSHVGLVDEGRRHFDSLIHVYGIAPTIEHHACMIDILGRAGRLDEVEHFINKMILVPDASIWQTVLGACRLHKNVELGERAAKKLFEIKPHLGSTYILLSNIYAASGRWADVARVRAMMSSRGVKKEPGCSWIDVDGQVHVFLANDGSHLMTKEIYLKLKELTDEITSAGYIPNTEYVLQDVADGDKKESLLYHSERLALVYGLISTKSIHPIRIFKNLRICGDCHNAIKFMSSITRREFIIRDASRFHHFQHGYCSCQDYW